jgi:VIT1/CCC1 family predicted Fe2+/Mn2+ transporter
VGLLPLLLVIGGAGAAIYGANTWLSARTEELERPGTAAPRGRPGALTVRLGVTVAVAGVALLILDALIHAVLAIATLALVVVAVAIAVAVLGRLGGARRR